MVNGLWELCSSDAAEVKAVGEDWRDTGAVFALFTDQIHTHTHAYQPQTVHLTLHAFHNRNQVMH